MAMLNCWMMMVNQQYLISCLKWTATGFKSQVLDISHGPRTACRWIVFLDPKISWNHQPGCFGIYLFLKLNITSDGLSPNIWAQVLDVFGQSRSPQMLTREWGRSLVFFHMVCLELGSIPQMANFMEEKCKFHQILGGSSRFSDIAMYGLLLFGLAGIGVPWWARFHLQERATLLERARLGMKMGQRLQPESQQSQQMFVSRYVPITSNY